MSGTRIGVDLGGTKIEAVLLAGDGSEQMRRRVPTPPSDYAALLEALAALVTELQQHAGAALPVGLGTPGAVSRLSGAMKNCNSTCLNGHHLREDLERRLGCAVHIANDADCMVLSEATDGAGAGAHCVFGAILGTGVGGGVAVGGRLLQGPNAIAGEWGHNPLPASCLDSEPRRCYCGREHCIETYLSGPGLALTHRRLGGPAMAAQDVAQAAQAGDGRAQAAVDVYSRQLAAALGLVINILDPEVVVLAGGVSGILDLYTRVPQYWGEFVFSDAIATRLLPARFGAASGVRGAAWLWP